MPSIAPPMPIPKTAPSPSSTESPYDWMAQSLQTIHRAHWHRSPQILSGRPGAVVERDGRTLINFASNDYLGLAGDDRLMAAAIEAIQTNGTGSTGSRLITGQRALHRELEQAIAQLKQTEDAIVFSSGYLANLGTIAALVGPRDLILNDAYNHSSLLAGAKLSGATVVDYRHGDLQDLGDRLQSHRSHYRRCLILTDTVFSMDGDLAPLPEILDLAEAFSAMVLVDEAHGTGVFGATGAGCVEALGCSGRSLIQMGTLSKALGSLGGYVAGSATLVDFLRNRAASWIYTTGLSPADTAAALAAIRVVNQEPDRRAALWHNTRSLRQALQDWLATQPTELTQGDRAYRLLPSESPILCLQVPNPATVSQLGRSLTEAGLWVGAIRPPTVPTSRLRLTLMATHQPEHLAQLMAALRSAIPPGA